MSNFNNKTTQQLFRNTHEACKSSWKDQRRVQNSSPSYIGQNKQFYLKSKGKSITSRAGDLLRQRERNQKYDLNKTMADIEEVSFGINRTRDKERFKERYNRSVTFLESKHLDDREIQLEELARQEEEAKMVGNMRKYKYYFLENLRQGHPKYSPYKMFDRTIPSPLPHHIPSPRVRPLLEYSMGTTSRLSPSVRFNYGVSTPSPLQRVESPLKSFNETSTGISSKYVLPKRPHTQSTATKHLNDNLPSKEELKSIFGSHQEQIIEFLIDLVKK